MGIVVTETFRESYRSLNITHHIFSLNYDELKELLHQLKKTDAILLWDIRNQEDFRQFQIQILQKFHNFLASLKTFVDHTRLC